MELTGRKLKILAAVVDAYVETGEPVGSKALAMDLGVSSATIRNEMADLSEMGLLEQPHTSAGRIPSQRGYRLYVDRVMEQKPVPQAERLYLGSLLQTAGDPDRLLESVSQALALMTRFVAVSTTPAGGMAKVRAVQFVQTSRRSAMILLLSSTRTIKTRVFHCDFDLSPEILRIFFRTVNEKVAGMPVSEITPAFIQSFAASLGEMTLLMSSALMALLEVAQASMETGVRLNGQMNLLFYPEFEGGGARRVMDFLGRPQELADLLLGQPPRVHVLIGRETRQPELCDSSVVFARYSIGGDSAGAIGVIGPTRMDYARLVPGVEYLSRMVGNLLTEWMKED